MSSKLIGILSVGAALAHTKVGAVRERARAEPRELRDGLRGEVGREHTAVAPRSVMPSRRHAVVPAVPPCSCPRIVPMLCSVAMREQSMHTKHDPQRRRFRSLRGFVAGAEASDPDSLDPLRIVALLERSGGRASKRMLAASLRLSMRAVDDAVRTLESEGVVSASRMPQADDATVRLYRPPTRDRE